MVKKRNKSGVDNSPEVSCIDDQDDQQGTLGPNGAFKERIDTGYESDRLNSNAAYDRLLEV